jgi:hypothetical protein
MSLVSDERVEELLAEVEELRAQIARNDEHYDAAMKMSEKHRKLWVEASQRNAELVAVLKDFDDRPAVATVLAKAGEKT